MDQYALTPHAGGCHVIDCMKLRPKTHWLGVSLLKSTLISLSAVLLASPSIRKTDGETSRGQTSRGEVRPCYVRSFLLLVAMASNLLAMAST